MSTYSSLLKSIGSVCVYLCRSFLSWISAGGRTGRDLDDGLLDGLLGLLRRVVDDLSQVKPAGDLYCLSVQHRLVSLEGDLEGVVQL